jgi:hypothetical protein
MPAVRAAASRRPRSRTGVGDRVDRLPRRAAHGSRVTIWAYALARTDAGRLGVTTYLVPPISVLLGWALLSEAPPALAYAGGALCLAGVAISRRR